MKGEDFLRVLRTTTIEFDGMSTLERSTKMNCAPRAYRKPREASLVEKLREFFERNPYEELSYEDIQIKFGCALRSAYNAVAELRMRDAVETRTVVRRKS